MVIDDIIIRYYAVDRRRGLRWPAMTYIYVKTRKRELGLSQHSHPSRFSPINIQSAEHAHRRDKLQ